MYWYHTNLENDRRQLRRLSANILHGTRVASRLLPLDYGFVASTLCSGIDGRMLSISWGFISTILFSGTFCGHFAVMKVEAAAVGLAAAVLCEHNYLLYHKVAPQETVFFRLRRFNCRYTIHLGQEEKREEG